MKKAVDPRMHSAEHILNQTMVRLFGCGRAVSAHIEKKKSKCDYILDHEPDAEMTSLIERQVKEVIESDLPVREEFLPRQEAETRFNLERLPDSADETIRIVLIGDYDSCPCIGKHVSSTGDIGGFRITTTSFDKGRFRIRFKLSIQKD